MYSGSRARSSDGGWVVDAVDYCHIHIFATSAALRATLPVDERRVGVGRG